MVGGKKISRRELLRGSAFGAACVIGFPSIVPSSVFGASSPSNMLNMGCIGVGSQGIGDMKGFLGGERDRLRVTAVCDVNRGSGGYMGGMNMGGREPAKGVVEQHYAAEMRSGVYKGCDTYEDYRDLLNDDDIDVVLIATPDHWHGLTTIAAAKAGKDIYCEKPLSLTIGEGRVMSDTVRQYGRVFQCGSQQRSNFNFRRVCELVRNGRIGKLHTVRCGLPGGTPDYSNDGYGSRKNPEPVPDGFNYDMWLGPAPFEPYCPARCHPNFRWILDYSGGQLTDWGGHHPDIAQWGMDTEDTGPVKIINAHGRFEHNQLWNTAREYYFECIYENGVRLVVSNREKWGGVTFEGDGGWVTADRGRHNASSGDILRSNIGSQETHLYKSSDHKGNFIDCVISRKTPIAPIETAHRSITLAHLGNISMRLGRDLGWDPEKERFVNDPEADRMLMRPMRGEYSL